MICAAPWKTCNCPWFNYARVDDDDRLHDMRVPDVVRVADRDPDPARVLRRSSTRRRSTREDRRQHERDEYLATRLHAQLNLDVPTPASSQIGGRVWAVGNSGSHHMNESYAVRPVATSRPAPLPTRFFPRRRTTLAGAERHRASAPPPPPPTESQMAGLSRDGSRRGANRVGTWLQHVELDPAEVEGRASRVVELDEWGVRGSVMGID